MNRTRRRYRRREHRLRARLVRFFAETFRERTGQKMPDVSMRYFQAKLIPDLISIILANEKKHIADMLNAFTFDISKPGETQSNWLSLLNFTMVGVDYGNQHQE